MWHQNILTCGLMLSAKIQKCKWYILRSLLGTHSLISRCGDLRPDSDSVDPWPDRDLFVWYRNPDIH